MVGTTKARRRTRAMLPMVGLLAAFGGALTLNACDDGDNANLIGVGVNPNVVVATFKDSTFNFTTLHTFSMPDTVVHFNPATGTPLDVSRQFDHTALNAVRSNLIARGYTQVTASASVIPSFVVLVGATATTNYNAFVGYSWFSAWGFYSGWAFYAPGFNNSWGIVYPWYGTVGVTAYDRGTMIVDLSPDRPDHQPAEYHDPLSMGWRCGLAPQRSGHRRECDCRSQSDVRDVAIPHGHSVVAGPVGVSLRTRHRTFPTLTPRTMSIQRAHRPLKTVSSVVSKGAIAKEIGRVISNRGMTQTQVSRMTGEPQPQISGCRRHTKAPRVFGRASVPNSQRPWPRCRNSDCRRETRPRQGTAQRVAKLRALRDASM